MTLQELRYVAAVGEARHFGRAAEACHVSQPTLSAQLKKLEEWLGVALFERTNKSVRMTPIGEKIVEQARLVLREAERIEEMAAAHRDPLAQPLQLGVIPTLNPYLLPWLMPPLQREYPRLKLRVKEDLTDHLIAQLQRHELDAVLLALPVHEPDLVTVPLFDEPFLVASPRGHRFSKRAEVSEQELAEENLLLLSEGHCLREQALAICGSGFERQAGNRSDFRATSIETLRQMVAAGFGCTLLPALAVSSAAGGGEGVGITRFADPRACRRIGLAWRRSFPRAAMLEEFGNFILRHLPREVRNREDGALQPGQRRQGPGARKRSRKKR